MTSFFQRPPRPTREDVRSAALHSIRRFGNNHANAERLRRFIEEEKAFLRSQPNQLIRSPLLSSAIRLLNGIERALHEVAIQQEARHQHQVNPPHVAQQNLTERFNQAANNANQNNGNLTLSDTNEESISNGIGGLNLR